MLDQKLVRESDGELRPCPKNFYILGFWKTLFLFWKKWGYISTLKNISWEEAWESILNVIMLIMFIVLFPVTPFLQAFGAWRRAVKEVKREEKSKGC